MDSNSVKIFLLSAALLACMACSDRKEDKPDSKKLPEPVAVENDAMYAMWGDTDLRYDQDRKPSTPCVSFPYTAWNREKASAEMVLWAKTALSDVRVSVSELKSGGNVIPASAFSVNFLGYVIGEKLNMGQYSDCSSRETGKWPTVSVADRLDNDASVSVGANNAQPVWVSVKVPAGTPAGVYEGVATISASGMSPLELPVWLNVSDHQLPEPHDWTFHLDLWQHPDVVANYAKVTMWSDAHFEYMRPLMAMLAESGQKVITTQLTNSRMIVKTKKSDGSWSYDYTVFDKWVSFMMEQGIDAEIDCYGIVPWEYRFEYFDEATGLVLTRTFEPGSISYNNFWTPFLQDFKKHLQSKGWYEKTYLGFDERAEKEINAAIDMIKAAVPDFRISQTGIYFDSVEKRADIFCITYENEYPDGIVENRRTKGLRSTYYICCGQRYPNTFVASPPAEGAWLAWAARAKGLDGVLRWTYCMWDNTDPVHDARHWGGPSGDRYIVYPDCRSSVRYEKVIEGIQDYEKTSILLKEWEASGNRKKISALNSALARFTFQEIPDNGAEPSLHQAKMAIDL